MRNRFGRSLIPSASLAALCACCAFFSAPAVASGGGFSFDRRVLILLAMGCIVGMIAGWVNGGPRETGERPLGREPVARVVEVGEHLWRGPLNCIVEESPPSGSEVVHNG